MADIFISHSGKDNEVAAAIGERIRCERPSWSFFYDKDNIRAGQRWQERLREELTSCRVVLALLSRNWLGSPWCFTEAVTATFRGKDVVGVETEDLTSDDLARAPPILHERQRVRLRDGDDRSWREILEALDRSGLDPDDWFPIAPNVGPYPGLVTFDEKDAGVFFGRKQEITEYLGILDTLRGPDRSQVLVISGASGSGKSSLLRAGLIPRLRRKHGWIVVSPFEVVREPVRNLLDRLSEVFAGLGIPADGLNPTNPPNEPARLAQILDQTFRQLEQRATGAWILLPLDQAEAMLAGDRTGDLAKLLLDALAQLLSRRTRHVVIAATIRTEFVPRLEAILAGSEVRLRQAPLSAIGSLAEVIEKPAERFGIELEPGLSERIVEDVHTAEALPLLAYTLKELNKRGGGDRRLTLDEYQGLGGVQGAIAAKLETVLSDPEPSEAESHALRRAFTRYLIRVDEGAVEGERLLRRVALRTSLPQRADRLLRRLVDAGLLTTKDGTIELAHERLINDWPKLPLKTWLTQDATDRRLIDQLRQRVNDDTLPDGLLAQAGELLQRDNELAAEEPKIAKLVQRSKDRKLARERRRWMFFGLAVIVAAGFAALAGWALYQWNEAEKNLAAAQDQAARQALQEFGAEARNYAGGGTSITLNKVNDLMLARAAPYLAQLRSLKAVELKSNYDLQNLEPIKQLNGLVSLKLSGIKSSSLAPLQEMLQLKELTIDSLYIQELDSLTALKTNLIYFDLSNSLINNFEPLKELTKLESLKFYEIKSFRDLEPLRSLDNLKILNLRGTMVTDLAPLSGLRNLTEITISGKASIESLMPLKELRKLNSLDVTGGAGQKIDSLEALKGMNSLKTLILQGTGQLADLAPLANLPNLTYLDLSGGRQINRLVALPALTTLDLTGTRVMDLGPLKVSKDLQELTLTRVTPIQSLEPLKELRELRTLKLIGANGVTDLEPLRDLPINLLDITDANGIETLEPLKGKSVSIVGASPELNATRK